MQAHNSPFAASPARAASMDGHCNMTLCCGLPALAPCPRCTCTPSEHQPLCNMLDAWLSCTASPQLTLPLPAPACSPAAIRSGFTLPEVAHELLKLPATLQHAGGAFPAGVKEALEEALKDAVVPLEEGRLMDVRAVKAAAVVLQVRARMKALRRWPAVGPGFLWSHTSFLPLCNTCTCLQPLAALCNQHGGSLLQCSGGRVEPSQLAEFSIRWFKRIAKAVC